MTTDYFEKRALNLWTSAGGKVKLADKLMKMFPANHDAYTEVFAGSAAVFFRKDKVKTEALNDRNTELMKSLEIVRGLSDADIKQVSEMSWTGDRKTWNDYYKQDPTTIASKNERLHRYLYLSKYAFGNMVDAGFAGQCQGRPSGGWKRLERGRDRLQGVSLYTGDYAPVLRKHDGESTLHFIDPPYPGYNARIGESEFDEPSFMREIRALKGAFLITYGVRGDFPGMLKDTDFVVSRIYPRRGFGGAGNMGGAARLGTLIVTNYTAVHKLDQGLFDDDEYVIEPWTPAMADMARDDDMYSGIDLRPSADMAILAGEALRKNLKAPYPGPLAEKITSREPLTVDEVLELCGIHQTLEKSADARLVYGGEAGEAWSARVFQAIFEREASVGRRYVPVTKGIRIDETPILLKRDFVVTKASGGVLVASTDAAMTASAKQAIGTLSDFIQADFDDSFSDVAHAPAYDLYLVPSPEMGIQRELAVVTKRLDFAVGDHGHVSLQKWVDAKSSTNRIAFRRERDDSLQVVNVPDPSRLEKMELSGTPTPLDVTDVVAIGADGWDRQYAFDDVAFYDAFQGKDVAEIRFGGATGVQKATGDWVVSSVDGESVSISIECGGLSGDYVIAKVANIASSGKGTGWTKEKIAKAVTTSETESVWCLFKLPDVEPAEESITKRFSEGEEASYEILAKKEHQRIVVGAVLIPEETDLQGDIISVDSIEKAAHDYLSRYRGTGVMHNDFKRSIQVVESYIAPVDFVLGGQKITKGTWMLVFKILDDAIWSQVMKGELQGFSIGGYTRRTTAVTEA